MISVFMAASFCLMILKLFNKFMFGITVILEMKPVKSHMVVGTFIMPFLIFREEISSWT